MNLQSLGERVARAVSRLRCLPTAQACGRALFVVSLAVAGWFVISFLAGSTAHAGTSIDNPYPNGIGVQQVSSAVDEVVAPAIDSPTTLLSAGPGVVGATDGLLAPLGLGSAVGPLADGLGPLADPADPVFAPAADSLGQAGVPVPPVASGLSIAPQTGALTGGQPITLTRAESAAMSAGMSAGSVNSSNPSMPAVVPSVPELLTLPATGTGAVGGNSGSGVGSQVGGVGVVIAELFVPEMNDKNVVGTTRVPFVAADGIADPSFSPD